VNQRPEQAAAQTGGAPRGVFVDDASIRAIQMPRLSTTGPLSLDGAQVAHSGSDSAATTAPGGLVHDDGLWMEAIRLARLRIWIFFDDPDSSRMAYLTSILILTLIMISSVTFCLETMHNFENRPDRELIFFIIEVICIATFTLEYLLKMMTAPKLGAFLIAPLNLVDLISILPFYLEQAASSFDMGSTRIFRTVRLVRVFRVLKLGGRFGKIQVVAKAMNESLDMLAMMMFLLALTIIIFSTLIYYTERGNLVPGEVYFSRKTDVECDDTADLSDGYLFNPDDGLIKEGCSQLESPFKSIPDCFWWCMVTLMTVGYGDEVPTTNIGKLVACVSMLASVLLLALPISVIGTEFTQQWMEYKHNAAGDDKRKLAPRFMDLKRKLKTHIQMLDETLRKMRDTQTDMDERVVRMRTMIQQKVKEHQVIRRKALLRGKNNVAKLVAKTSRLHQGDQLETEVQEIEQQQNKLQELSDQVRLLRGEGFPEKVDECIDKYVLMMELKEDDYEMLAADIDMLHFRVLRWQKGQNGEGVRFSEGEGVQDE